MKKLILTFGIFLAGVFYINAQDKATIKANKMVDHLNEVIGLSPDQVAKIQPLAEDFVKAREANRQQYAGDVNGRKSADKTAHENYKAQLKTILSPQQIEKLRVYNSQQKANKKGESGENEDQPGENQ
jgi:hypothetical protein